MAKMDDMIRRKMLELAIPGGEDSPSSDSACDPQKRTRQVTHTTACELAFEASQANSPTTLTRSSKMSSTPGPARYSSLSLKDIVCLCAGARDDEAWEEFVSRVGKAISLTIMRTTSLWGDASRSLVEDLVQATYLKLWEDGCRLLRDFAIQYPEAILGYLKKTAANVTHDYFKHVHSQSSGGQKPHVSTSDVDPEAGREVHGSQEKIAFGVFLNEIDEYLKHSLTGPEQERDHMIFWLYFRQGMSTKEIASLPTIGLSAKGVGSVIERLKHCIREQILGSNQISDDDGEQLRLKANSLEKSFEF
jgi:RNA polymerase sigma factor (sigma-70 family)